LGALEGVSNSILGAFGSSVKEVGLGFQLMWNYLKSGGIAAIGLLAPGLATFFEHAADGARTLAETIGSVWNSILTVGDFAYNALGAGWAGMFAVAEIAGLEMLSAVTSGFNALYRVALDAHALFLQAQYLVSDDDSAEQYALFDAMRKVNEARATLTTDDTAQQTRIDELQAEAAAVADLDAAWEQAENSQRERMRDFNQLLDETIPDLAGLSDTTAAFWEEQAAAALAEREALMADISLAASERERREALNNDARIWQRAHLTDIDAALQTLASEGAGVPGMNAQTLEAGGDLIRERMEDSLRSLSAEIRSGGIDHATASSRLADLQQQAVADALALATTEQVPPAAVAGGAGGLTAGITPAMWSDLVNQLEQSAPTGQHQRFTVRFQGDTLARDLARTAAIEQAAMGGH
ncbi:MAG TPA: hypothetical protein VFH61_00485, partial [Thermoleophilia bacterium]|nr:hypothetical protein [Thermoleophilia bacterium]